MWLPKLEFRMDVIQAVASFTTLATDGVTMAANQLDNFATAADRGRFVENQTPANLRGNFPSIDHLEFIDNDTASISQVKSRDVASADALLATITSDANALYGAASIPLEGTDANGNFQSVTPDKVAVKSLNVYIPENHSGYLRSIASQLRQLAKNTESVINVVPVRGWRGRSR